MKERSYASLTKEGLSIPETVKVEDDHSNIHTINIANEANEIADALIEDGIYSLGDVVWDYIDTNNKYIRLVPSEEFEDMMHGHESDVVGRVTLNQEIYDYISKHKLLKRKQRATKMKERSYASLTKEAEGQTISGFTVSLINGFNKLPDPPVSTVNMFPEAPAFFQIVDEYREIHRNLEYLIRRAKMFKE